MAYEVEMLQTAHQGAMPTGAAEVQLLDGLTSDLMSKWSDAQRARQPRDENMLDSLRQRAAQYSPAMLAALNQTAGNKTFFPLADWKTLAAAAKLRGIFTRSGATPPFGLGATEDPHLPVDVTQIVQQRVMARARQVVEATQGEAVMDPAMMTWLREAAHTDAQMELRREAAARAKRNERTMKDAMEEGGANEAWGDAIENAASMDAGFVRAVPRLEPRLRYQPGVPTPVVEDVLVEHWASEHPLHVYPEPGIERLDDGYVFVWREYTRAELTKFFGVPGVRVDKLRRVLSSLDGSVHGFGGREQGLESAKQELERKGPDAVTTMRGRFDMLNYYGTVWGQDLLQWGYAEAYGQPNFGPEDAVECQAWMVDGEVIKVALNENPLRLKPIFKTVFRRVPGGFWGKGVPEIIRPIEANFNAVIRNIQNNQAVAAGPQVIVNSSSVRNALDVTMMRPWMIWETTVDPYGTQRPVVEFHQPDSRAHELMALASFYDSYADQMLGIPSYVGGDTDLKGAGRTSGGLHQLRTEAGVILQDTASNIDEMTRRAVLWLYSTWLHEGRIAPVDMGDVRVLPMGTAKLAETEQSAHSIVGLLQATANPEDIAIMGREGRRSMLFAALQALKVDLETPAVPGLAHARLGEAFVPAQGQPQALPQGGGAQAGGEPEPGGPQG